MEFLISDLSKDSSNVLMFKQNYNLIIEDNFFSSKFT